MCSNSRQLANPASLMQDYGALVYHKKNQKNMKLTHATDLGLRVLMVLSVNQNERQTIPGLAAALDVSENHLVKICIRLTSFGYIRSRRGRRGGVELAIPPDEIRVGDAIARLEDDFCLVECMGEESGNCVLSPACDLRRLLESATAAFFDTLNSMTMSDLVSRRRFKNLVKLGSALTAKVQAS